MRMLVVDAVTDLTDGVRQIGLTAPDGGSLQSFTPGSHVVVSCGIDRQGHARRNAYSLTGAGIVPDAYSISVRRCDAGRGGSLWMHGLSVGESVEVTGPRSGFAPVLTARHHVLVAGGIGVAPILSHARAAARWGRSFEVHYVSRGGDGPHLADLAAVCAERLTTYRDAEALWTALGPALLDRPLGSHLYTCGPASLMEEVDRRASSAGWPGARIHHEHFGIGDLEPGRPFVARLSRSGLDVEVPSGTSLLDALVRRGVSVPNLCRQGVCGECRTPVVGGVVEHRDLYLSDDEKMAGDCMMPCVSRAAGSRLELEL
ncbi:ferredoxin-NADP reductase [Rhodococcus sp. OK519]|uniref:PDR/VanB family oxidoreductase n=1 Tax=Rhodococcus sp. OK519 TaxID=2135729 RepID=UPI000D466AE2|nr:ferredoxin-NADP reductase [Rhodococcus sp. OK519]